MISRTLSPCCPVFNAHLQEVVAKAAAKVCGNMQAAEAIAKTLLQCAHSKQPPAVWSEAVQNFSVAQTLGIMHHSSIGVILPTYADQVVNQQAFDEVVAAIEAARDQQAAAIGRLVVPSSSVVDADSISGSSRTGAGAIAGSSSTPSVLRSVRDMAATAPRVVQLLGMAGMGKSTLALQVAQALEEQGDRGLIWQQRHYPIRGIVINPNRSPLIGVEACTL